MNSTTLFKKKIKTCDYEKNKPTYISLFSSAGIGCYGFQKAGFECIATNELIEKRLKIQKYNKKCSLDSGYIEGDITKIEVQNKLIYEVERRNLINKIDVLIATPPCQGMSVANQKKKNEMKRNSLVVKALDMIELINPKIFIMENVRQFLKTTCIGNDEKIRTIEEQIFFVLENKYKIESKIINFKNYGANSSRTRTIVVGVRNDMIKKISPFEIFPTFKKEKKLKEIIGNFKSLKTMDEFDESNPLHHFKKYDPRMVSWIKNLKEGQSAFDNLILNKKPHKIVDGKIVLYKKGFGDKYKRMSWENVGPCVHTANDCLASQNTIHPSDNRVLSIAELMKLMNIPSDFKWTDVDLNKLNRGEKIEWINKNQGNIRKAIGESVPTGVFYEMANNIKEILIKKNDFLSKTKKFELENKDREKNSAFYTSKINLTYIFENLPKFKGREISILEPSVGSGNFLPLLFKKYDYLEKVKLTVVDIDEKAIINLKKILKETKVPSNFKIKFVSKDYLLWKTKQNFDLIIGNPPFKNVKNDSYKNLFEAFWYKSLSLSKKIIFVNPKYVLSSKKYENLRNILEKSNISKIIDFGELGFEDVKIETVVFFLSEKKERTIKIVSVPNNTKNIQEKKYIFDKKLPYWIIYRNIKFDDVFSKIDMDIFKIKKNYELSNRFFTTKKQKNSIRVIRSKNIDFYEGNIVNIENYDKYIDLNLLKNSKFFSEIQNSSSKLYLIPNLTYYPRVIEKPNDIIVNGSVLIAETKNKNLKLNKNNLDYYFTDEFRNFYKIAFNLSTRTLNIDENTVKFFGVLK